MFLHLLSRIPTHHFDTSLFTIPNTGVVICPTSRGLFGLPVVYGTMLVLPLIDLAWSSLHPAAQGIMLFTLTYSAAICLRSFIQDSTHGQELPRADAD